MKEYELREKVGNLDQIAYAKRVVMSDGPEGGLKLILVDNGLGLNCQILEDRCLDIGKLSYKGINLSFLAKPGYINIDQIQAKIGEFPRYFHGGMLYTCGLENVGPASCDNNREYLLHGHLGITPAQLLTKTVDFDKGVITITGVIRQSELFGTDLALERTITIPLTSNKIIIDDIVRNMGFLSEHVLLLYHFNFGWPMLSEKTVITINSKVEPRDVEAKQGLDKWHLCEQPQYPYPEQVFYHTPIVKKDQLAHVSVSNPELKLAVDIAFDPKQLPELIEWKSMVCGDYALGIEPSTSRVDGRKQEIANGRTVLLQPGENRTFHVELNIIEL